MSVAEERMCLMTVYAGQADSQSLAELNRLLDEGWRISGIDPTLSNYPRTGGTPFAGRSL